MLTFALTRINLMFFNDNEYDVTSSNNLNTYDHLYLNTDGYRFSSVHGIRLFKDKQLLRSVAVSAGGGSTGIHDHSFSVNSERLVICCGDSVFCLAMPELTLEWKTIADTATCFGIYSYKEDYIVHGELEITRLSRHGEILWQQSGADIFTTVDGKDNFIITDDYFLATDFNHRKYRFDLEGNIIE